MAAGQGLRTRVDVSTESHVSSRQALVVDDSQSARRMAASFLRGLGFEVAEATNGCEGLSRLASLRAPVLVLVDWNMPELDGIGFVRAVRSHAAYAHVLLMMVTTEVEMAKVALALDAGANEYLMKPFTREMVAEKLSLLGLSTESECSGG